MQTSARARYGRIVTIGLSAVHQGGSGLKRYAKRVERAAAIDRELSVGLGAADGRAVQTRHAGCSAGDFEIYQAAKGAVKAPLLRLVAQR